MTITFAEFVAEGDAETTAPTTTIEQTGSVILPTGEANVAARRQRRVFSYRAGAEFAGT